MRFLMAAAMLVSVLGAGVAQAQDVSVETRVDRLEREMRAVQRKVFPGGAGQMFEPEITPETDAANAPGIPATSPVLDLTQRVVALESSLATVTGQVEETQHRLKLLEDGNAALEARLKAIEDKLAAAAAAVPEPAPTVAEGPGEVPATAAIVPPAEAEKPAAKPAEPPAKPAAGSRAEAVAAVDKPSTGDPAEDGYVYGYRLWSAKLYPEARRELETVAKKYPNHRRASFAQNLLGRAYLDAGAPSLAAVAFYENYKNNPNGERAPDSLFYLAQALVELKKPAGEVCKVYTELMDLYGDKISEKMKSDVAEGRAAAKCK